MEGTINTVNDQRVGMRGPNLVVLLPKTIMTCDEALMHAAYLVAMAEPSATLKFAEVLEAVQNT